MKIKNILLSITLLLLPLTCFADWYEDACKLTMTIPKFPAGMTFLADYSDGLLDADRFSGVSTATYDADRTNAGTVSPGTYFDSSGVMQVMAAVDKTARFNHGYYDTTGWHAFTNGAGLMVEGASTNYLKQGIFAADGNADGIADNWLKVETNINGTTTDTLVDVSSTFNVGATVQSERIQYTGVAGDDATTEVNINSDPGAVGSFTTGDEVTLSCWLKGSSSGTSVKLEINVRNAAGGALELFVTADLASNLSSTEWRRFTLSATTTHADTSRIIGKVLLEEIADGETIDIQIACIQVENSPYATSFIPTTTAALTRNAETLKYEISGNRTAAVESCVVKLAPEWASTEDSNRWITSTDTKERQFYFTTIPDLRVRANNTDSPNCIMIDDSPTFSAFTSKTFGYNIQHSSPYIAGYEDGVTSGANETSDNFTDPAWGTYWWLGSKNDGTLQFNGTIFGIAFWDRVLTARDMENLHSRDWRALR